MNVKIKTNSKFPSGFMNSMNKAKKLIIYKIK